MSDIVERLRAAAAHPDNQHGPHEWLTEAAAEIERLRKKLSETALTALSIDSRAMELQLLCDRQATRLAEAVEVMRACRSTYVENDDAAALERIIDRINGFLAKMEEKP